MYAPERSRLTNSRSGVMGCSARTSVKTKAASRTAPATKAAMVPRSAQPSEAARTKPYTRVVIPRVDVAAPVRSKRPGCRSVSGR